MNNIAIIQDTDEIVLKRGIKFMSILNSVVLFGAIGFGAGYLLGGGCISVAKETDKKKPINITIDTAKY